MALVLWLSASQTISSTRRWTCVRRREGGCPGRASTDEAVPSQRTTPIPVTAASVKTAGRHARGGRTTARGPKAVKMEAALRAADQVFRHVRAPRNRTGAGRDKNPGSRSAWQRSNHGSGIGGNRSAFLRSISSWSGIVDTTSLAPSSSSSTARPSCHPSASIAAAWMALLEFT